MGNGVSRDVDAKSGVLFLVGLPGGAPDGIRFVSNKFGRLRRREDACPLLSSMGRRKNSRGIAFHINLPPLNAGLFLLLLIQDCGSRL